MPVFALDEKDEEEDEDERAEIKKYLLFVLRMRNGPRATFIVVCA